LKINILVNGCNGNMGKIICNLISKSNCLKVIAGFDSSIKQLYNFPTFKYYKDLLKFISNTSNSVDVIIDFSAPNSTFDILKYVALPFHIPIVIATTGFSNNQLSTIKSYSKNIPIFISSNMSFEINLLDNLLRYISPKMNKYDIEILEIHHNQKKDVPSGTAKMLANSINESLNNSKKIVYERTGKREKDEIGISSIRGGNIVGEHTISFFGQFDSLKITHTAYSREIYAEGAIKASIFMFEHRYNNGLYEMKDLII